MPEEENNPTTTNQSSGGDTAVVEPTEREQSSAQAAPAAEAEPTQAAEPANYSSASVNLAQPGQGDGEKQQNTQDYLPQTPPPEDVEGSDASKMQQQAPPPPPPETAQTAPQPEPSSKKPVLLILIVLLLLLLVGGGVWWWLAQDDEPVEELNLSVDQLTTTDTTPIVTGEISGHDADEDITAEVDGVEYEAVTVNESWEADVTEELEPGSYDVTVSAYDLAGEREEFVGTDAVVIEEDEEEPEPLEADVDPVTTEETTPTLSGTVSDAERVEALQVTIDEQQIQPEIEEDGSWQAEVSAELAPGSYDVSVLLVDVDGEEFSQEVNDVVAIEEAPEPEPEPEPEEEPEETPSTGPEDEEEPEGLPDTGADVPRPDNL